MNLLALAGIVGIIFAAEPIVSPLPDNFNDTRPIKTFAQIGSPGIVLGVGLENVSSPPLTLVSVSTNNIMPKDIDPSAIPEATSPATPTPTPTLVPTLPPTGGPTPTPTEIVKAPKRSTVTIAFLGDSMIDTLGPGFPAFADALKKTYPGLTATILNYGVGGTNIEYGIERITHDYDYLGNHIPSLASQKPDIVVIESFGYNPFPMAIQEEAINRHWLDLAKAVDTIKTTIPGAKIVIAATIAPVASTFGDNAPNISFSMQDKWQRTDVIKSYLESTTKFATSQNLPLIDAYHATLQSNGSGIQSLINPGDHIHPSDAGRAFFAQKTINTLLKTDWL